jgi:hypothetical protein
VRWQVEELPVIQVKLTEYQCQRVRCPGCGERPRGELPAEVAQSAFGPRYQAAVATLCIRNRISRRDVVECCEQLFGSRISTGAVDAILARASEALAGPHAALLAALRGAGAVNMDETGWRTAGEHGLKLCERVFWAWEIYTHTNDRRELKHTIRGLQRDFKPIIGSFASKRARNKYCRGMARNLIKAWPALWTFAKHPGVQPTNNHAERALRSAVIYRKLSLGT